MEYIPEKASRIIPEREFKRLDRMFAREGLSSNLRMAAAIACLQGAGDSANLTPILRLAVNGRKDFVEIYEVLLQGYLFCGYPRAIESFFCLKEAAAGAEEFDPARLKPSFLDDSGVLLERGVATSKLVHGKNFGNIRNKISALSPDLGYLMIAEGYGHVLSRPGLDIKTRELAAVSSISAISSKRQLNSHVRGCRNVGCDDIEIYEAIFTGSLWLPPGKVEESLGVWSDITGRKRCESVADFIE